MNLLQVISTTFRLYSSHVGWYLFAGLMLFLSALVGFGLFSSSLLASMMLSLPYGENGGWIQNPMAALLIIGCLSTGALIASAVLLAAIGSFTHICAQIGSGAREITILGFLEYAKKWGLTFWFIGMAQTALGLAVLLPVVVLAVLLEKVWQPLLIVGLIIGGIAFFLAQWPLWLAFSAQVVERRGVMGAAKSSLVCARRAPISGMAAMGISSAALLVPTPMLIFYPIYFFFVFMPLSTVLSLVYYESSKGMLR